ncbi:MAG: diguanylate cyclase [Rhizobiales bacterium]|nr:diguanylate cyclase [Rhizobacter sp.]
MTLPGLAAPLLRWVNTLKFKIVAVTVLTAVLAAVASTQLALTAMRADLERVLMENERDDGERMAAVLASKLDTLQLALKAVARAIKPGQLDDPAAMARMLLDRHTLAVLFDSFFAARPDGTMLARVEKGESVAQLPNVADRDYFRRAIAGDQPVVSDPLLGRIRQTPIVVVATPVLAPDGRSIGVIAGSLGLRATSLFSDLAGTTVRNDSHVLVMDRTGVLLAHPDPTKLLTNAIDEPGLRDVFQTWRDSGSPIDTRGMVSISGPYMVTMTGIPHSNWVLVHITPEEVLLAPFAAARRTAQAAAVGVGLLSALLAGVLAWHLTRPISRLRDRAQQLLSEDSPGVDSWPRERGEVGHLAKAFQRVVEQRQARQRETQALLQQLQAVLDHAEVGIALTRNGRFELVSRNFCRVFRSTPSQLTGQPTRSLYPSDAAFEAISQRATPLLVERGAFDGEIELLRRDGQQFWARVRGRVVVPGDLSQGTIWTLEDVTEMREQRERLTWASSHDSLTGLANRAAFEVLLEQATARAATEPFCALFIDLDRFKVVNDTSGHAAGDALLRDVSNVLAAQVRKSDTVARLGGDEFAVLLDHCPVAQAQVIAEKIRSAVIAYQLVWEGASHGVGASIGLVPVDATMSTAAEVLSAADAACYRAKRQGRNRVAMHAG